MGDGSLITPVKEVRHRRLMRARSHVSAHAPFAVPSGHRPEGPAAVHQQRAGLKSSCSSYLPQRAEGMKGKPRHETDGPDSQARQANKGHHSLK
jgi:hypothetical protein